MSKSIFRRFHQCIAVFVLGTFTGVALAADTPALRLATTTSTDNSGLLRYLLPRFEKATGIQIHTLAVGTGQALRLGANGDVDVLLVHAPEAETKFVNAGHGVNRRSVMYNDFVIVGPASDPAGLAGSENAVTAMRRLAQAKAPFVSRGDDSGTHKKENQLWRTAGVTPDGRWYRAAGQGMGKVLQMASELGGYTLTDRGTWLAMADKLELKLLVQGDERLFNPYAVIAVNPARYPDIRYREAMQLIAWLTSPQGQILIDEYRIADQRLFTPLAVVAKR